MLTYDTISNILNIQLTKENIMIIVNQEAREARKLRLLNSVVHKATNVAKNGYTRFSMTFNNGELFDLPPPMFSISLDNHTKGNVTVLSTAGITYEFKIN